MLSLPIFHTRFAAVVQHDWGCEVRFHDGAELQVTAYHHDLKYKADAHRCGYKGDTLGYCVDRVLCMLVFTEVMHGKENRVLRIQAEGRPVDEHDAVYDYLAAYSLQLFLKKHQFPPVADVPWNEMKRRLEEVKSSCEA